MRSRPWIGPSVAIIGAFVIWVGAFSPWARSSVDPAALQRAMAVDPQRAPDVADFIDASYTWVEGSDPAAWMLVFATVGFALAVVLLVRGQRTVAAIVAVLGGVVAIVGATTKVDPAALAAAIARDAEDGVVGTYAFGDGPLADAIIVHGGRGTTIIIAGGVLMVIGGLLAAFTPHEDGGEDPGYVPWTHPQDVE